VTNVWRIYRVININKTAVSVERFFIYQSLLQQLVKTIIFGKQQGFHDSSMATSNTADLFLHSYTPPRFSKPEDHLPTFN